MSKCQKEFHKVNKRPRPEDDPLDLLLSAVVEKTNKIEQEKTDIAIVKKAIMKDGYIHLIQDEDEKDSLKLKQQPREFSLIANSRDSKLRTLLFGKEEKNSKELLIKLRSILKKQKHKIPAILGA